MRAALGPLLLQLLLVLLQQRLLFLLLAVLLQSVDCEAPHIYSSLHGSQQHLCRCLEIVAVLPF
jgi:hypothetical protein